MEYGNYSNTIQKVIIKLGLLCLRQLGWDNLDEDEVIMKMNGKKDSLSEIINEKKKEIVIIKEELYNDKINFKKEINTLKQEKEKEIDEIKYNLRTQYFKEFEEKLKIEIEKKENSIVKEREITEILLKNCQEKISYLEETDSTHKKIIDKITDKQEFNNPTEQGNEAEKLVDEIVENTTLFFE